SRMEISLPFTSNIPSTAASTSSSFALFLTFNSGFPFALEIFLATFLPLVFFILTDFSSNVFVIFVATFLGATTFLIIIFFLTVVFFTTIFLMRAAFLEVDVFLIDTFLLDEAADFFVIFFAAIFLSDDFAVLTGLVFFIVIN